MKTYQMPCSRKVASWSKPSTFLITRKGRTQVFWTVETVPGMEGFPHFSACLNVCLTETGQMWLGCCSFLMTLNQMQVTLTCLRPQLWPQMRQAQKPFYLFPFPLRSALWLHFRLANTHIHGPAHIYFVPNSLSVNLACQSRLNMAVITGRYESHLSIALLPNVNDWRHTEIFTMAIKKIPYGYECAQQYSYNALQV